MQEAVPQQFLEPPELCQGWFYFFLQSAIS